MSYLLSKFFQLPLTGTFKNCTITYPQSHRKCHILRWYEWDLLEFCKQTSFFIGAIGTLIQIFEIVRRGPKNGLTPECKAEALKMV